MNPKLQKKFERIEAQREETFEFLQSLREEKLHNKPNGSWSPAQVAFHLLETEKGTLDYLNKKLQANPEEFKKAGAGTAFRAFLLKVVLGSPVKFKAPKRLQTPVEYPDLQELKREFEHLRNRWKDLLEKLDPAFVGKEVFKHPRSGRLSMAQTLDFVYDHFQHHVKQIRERAQ